MHEAHCVVKGPALGVVPARPSLLYTCAIALPSSLPSIFPSIVCCPSVPPSLPSIIPFLLLWIHRHFPSMCALRGTQAPSQGPHCSDCHPQKANNGREGKPMPPLDSAPFHKVLAFCCCCSFGGVGSFVHPSLSKCPWRSLE